MYDSDYIISSIKWQETPPVDEVIVDAPSTSSGTMETPAGLTPLILYPGTLYNVLPNLTQAFIQLADSLNSSKKPSIQAQVRELDQFNDSDTCKL